ncbi:hypothetical protein [Gimesia panareensis]|uniref:hypothetical protein n=1 Tax=Gimesia panareensis TaxID=2527978 RepID=UPI0011A41F43|nr:hypothetical protein [Gimesia panareensis]
MRTMRPTPDQILKGLTMGALQTNSSLHVKLRIHNPASKTLAKPQMTITSTLIFVIAFVVAI